MNNLKIKLNYKSLLKKTISSMAMLVFISMYTIIDSLFVSNYVSTTALAALNIVFPIITIISALGFMICSGGVSYVSIKLGEKEEEKSNSSFTLIYIFGIVSVALLSAICLVFLDSFFKLMRVTDLALIKLSKDYIKIIITFSFVFIMQVMVQFFLFVANKGHISFILTLISGCTNIFFDWFFIVKMNMGIQGAAYATSLGYLVSALYGTWFFFINKKGLHFVKPTFSIKIILKTCSNGISEMITNLSSSITTFLFNYIAMKYAGVDGVAAISIILYCQFLFGSIFGGFTIGTSPLLGFAYGAKENKYLKDMIILCLKLIAIFSIFMFLISFFQAKTVTKLFCNEDNPVYLLASNGLKLFSFSFLFCGFSMFTSSLFTSIGDGLRSGFSSFLRVFVFSIISLLILPIFFGFNGIFLAIPCAEVIMALVNTIFVKNFFKRLGN